VKTKILFLGGSPFQLPPIIYARQMGYYVITCDYLPENPGHKYANEYHNISTTDLDEVYKLACRAGISGIVSYASDPAAPTAAYVGNKLGLVSNPYESVLTLTNKQLYRKFLSSNGFNTPLFVYAKSFAELCEQIDVLKMPIIVKPVDSSGSKGVSKVMCLDELLAAYTNAIQFSRSKTIIAEEFIARKGHQVAGDGFVIDGKLVFRCFAHEHFNQKLNGLVPIGESFPLGIDDKYQNMIHSEIQRLLDLLEMESGALNFDVIIDNNDRVFLMEIGPRNGGNLIPEVIKHATGIDLVECTVEQSIGTAVSLEMPSFIDCYSSYIIHSTKCGLYHSVDIADNIRDKIVEKAIHVTPNQPVQVFNGSNQSIGSLILKYNNVDEMLNIMDNIPDYVNVKVHNGT